MIKDPNGLMGPSLHFNIGANHFNIGLTLMNNTKTNKVIIRSFSMDFKCIDQAKIEVTKKIVWDLHPRWPNNLQGLVRLQTQQGQT